MNSKKLCVAIIFLFVPFWLYCCSCMSSSVDIHHINSHKYWIKGKVTHRIIKEEGKFPMYEYSIEVLDQLKGTIASDEILVYTPLEDASCGELWEPSEKAIYMFLYKNKNGFQTGLCALNEYEEHIDEHYEGLIEDYRNQLRTEWLNRSHKIIATGKLENGLPEGKWVEYSGLGLIYRKEGEYRDGKKEGAWKESGGWRTDSRSEGAYINGKKEGTWISYRLDKKDKTWERHLSKEYKEGKLISTYQYGIWR